MSCFPKCPVPNFLLPKEMRTKRTTDCIERCNAPQCTGYGVYAVVPQRENCMNPELAEMLRCSACQDERLKRLMANRRNQYQCWLKSHIRQSPEIPFLWKPDRADIKFIQHGYTIEDCFPQDVRRDACKQRSEWKKKVKGWIKVLDNHYNTKVANACEKPIEDYIRLNLSNLCVSCNALERQKLVEKEGVAEAKLKLRDDCEMVHLRCGRCSKGKKKSRH